MHTELPRPFLALAPMDDVTETAFRQSVQAMASPDLFFTEFVNVDGLMSPGRPNLLKKLRFAPSETRLIAQLWGLKPENFKAVAAQIASGELAEELGLPAGYNFVGVDLNMGCPAKSEVQNGACSALIKRENWALASEIITATKSGLDGRLALSVKTRVGFNEVDMSWFSFLLGHELSLLTVHGRTRKQMSKVPADWELIGQVRQLRDACAPGTLIMGNGDVLDRAHAELLSAQYGLDGIMIGRGIFQNPFCFLADAETRWSACDRQERLQLYHNQVLLFAATWASRERNIKTLNKFCKIYVSGFNGARELRDQLMNAGSSTELLKMIESALN